MTKKTGVKRRHRLCTVCKHTERPRIEALMAAGVTLDKLSSRYGVSRDSLWRHYRNHVSDEAKATYLVGPARLEELCLIATEEQGSVLDHLKIVRSALFRSLEDRARANDHYGVAALSAQLDKVLRSIGTVTGEIQEIAANNIVNISNTTNILQTPAFAELQTGLLGIARRHAGARGEIIELLKTLDAKYDDRPKVIEARPEAVAHVA